MVQVLSVTFARAQKRDKCSKSMHYKNNTHSEAVLKQHCSADVQLKASEPV